VDESLFLLSKVMIGQERTLWESVLAAAFLECPPKASRLIPLPTAVAANLRQIIYGGILIDMMFQYSKGFGHLPQKLLQ